MTRGTASAAGGALPAAVKANAAVGWSPGRLLVKPGQGAGALQRERLPGLDAFWRGQPADAFAQRVAAVHTLCGHAHRLTAEQAIAAARGDAGLASPERLAALRAATLQEQLRRLLHDWPVAMPLDAAHRAASLAVLRAAPWTEVADADAWTAWWQHALLGMAPSAWLAGADAGGEAWLAAWAQQTDTPVARWLQAARPLASRVQWPAGVLTLAQDPGLQAWFAARLAAPEGAAFAQAPEGPGGPLETGPWARVADRPGAHAHNAWMRLIARLVDAVRLGLPGGAARLAQGSLALGAGTGMAWTETARGLLLHWVRLEHTADGLERIAACRIVSPTDWNFHPRGALAQWLGGLAAEPSARREAEWLLLAFDACVPVQWAEVGEAAHA